MEKQCSAFFSIALESGCFAHSVEQKSGTPYLLPVVVFRQWFYKRSNLPYNSYKYQNVEGFDINVKKIQISLLVEDNQQYLSLV